MLKIVHHRSERAADLISPLDKILKNNPETQVRKFLMESREQKSGYAVFFVVVQNCVLL